MASLSPPWVMYVSKVKKVFEKDPDIDVSFDENEMLLTFLVNNTDKYEALTNLFPAEKNFGGQVLNIMVLPANLGEKDTKYYLKKLFKGNEAVTEIQDVNISTNTMTYIQFEKKVIQYWADNLGDLNGNKSTLMENIARELFENVDGVFFCTDNGV